MIQILHMRYIFIGILASCTYMPLIQSMETSYIESKQVIENKATQPSNNSFIPWEDDPENPKLLRINLPHYIAKQCEKKELTQDQSLFLEKFKLLSLPTELTDQDKAILESLGYMFLFNHTQTKDGWKFQHGSLPQKIKPGCALYDKTAREQLRKKK